MRKLANSIKKNRRTIVSILVFFFSNTLMAQNVNFEWASNFSAPAAAQNNAYDNALDNSGNVYSTGVFYGTADFNPGAGTNNLTASLFDVFISKLDASGNYVWAKSFGGGPSIFGYSLTVDDSENVYITGGFTGTVDFDPGTGTNNLTSNGQYDVFVSKLDPSGNFLWAKSFGSSSSDEAYSIQIDAAGNIYTTGKFSGTVDFDPGAGTSNLTTNSFQPDVFISKLDPSGNFVWVKQMGDLGVDQARSIFIDDLGNIYTTGAFTATVDFDPGTGVSNLVSNGVGDIFVSKLNSNGDFVWAKKFGGVSSDVGYSIKADELGNVYISGSFMGTSDFDPGTGTYNLVSNGSTDIFVSKLNVSGDFLWAKSFGGTGQEIGESIDVDAAGNVYTTGNFSNTIDFDPGTGTYYLVSSASHNSFLSKLNSDGNFVMALNIGGNTEELTLDDNANIHLIGTFYNTVDFDPGSGVSNLTSNGGQAIFNLKLSCAPISVTETVSACNSYTFNGITYTNDNNTAMDTLVSSGGCDSIVTLNLTINHPSNSIDTQIACDAYTWIDGNTYVSSTNTAQYTLTNAVGCDSVITLNLTIPNLDLTTTLTSNIITSNATGAAYQWIDCRDSSVIVGASNASYTATSVGSYAVIVGEGNCTDTSACVSVTSVGIKGQNLAKNIYQLFPNPTSAQVSISNFDSTIDKISIINYTGKMLQSFRPQSAIIDMSELANGIYFIQIQIGEEINTQKVIKK